MHQHNLLVVIPTLNRPILTQICLGSLLGRRLDVCLIADPVADRVHNDFRRAFNFGSQKLWIIEHRATLSSGRNIGMTLAEEAGYEFVLFLDDDNLVPPEYAEYLVNYLIKTPEVVAVSGLIQTFGAVKERKWKHWKPAATGTYPLGIGQQILTKNRRAMFTTKVQVVPYAEYHDAEIVVDYFVNSWMQRASAAQGLRVEGNFGEEVRFTYLLGKQAADQNPLVFLPNCPTMFHLVTDTGGTREVKDHDPEVQATKEQRYIEMLASIGIDVDHIDDDIYKG